ncbi:hypothetical protein QJU23_10185 [Pasteurella atlantica]|uniref:Uncharacterized protein n=2 Tax=Pasteurellaceae TaxID=712 RepID=A0ACC6HPP5_9PAST|nr:hypothetical protein [Pasteurella atlantica]MDP8052778.1 hypothetical protein [Pasteurella atlantica]MDP8102087.1 hypothetical protein [Pasteurella atlantica]MDP8106075.1 hypothetical protein [Pasteurella atlantica]MDP8149477.1 hypothetical protein [Pasteurella atlantica]
MYNTYSAHNDFETYAHFVASSVVCDSVVKTYQKKTNTKRTFLLIKKVNF